MLLKDKTITFINSSNSRKGEENQNIDNIISALDFLRNEARKTNNEDIYRLIDYTFNICLHTYCIIKRHEMASFFEKDASQD